MLGTPWPKDFVFYVFKFHFRNGDILRTPAEILVEETSDAIPISSIDFDFLPNAPRAKAKEKAFAAGNLYENMAKQLEAFLKTQERRNPKMIEEISEGTNSVLGSGGLDHLDIENVSKISNNSNKTEQKAFPNKLEAIKENVVSSKIIDKDLKIPFKESESYQKSIKESRHIETPSQSVDDRGGWTPLVIGSLPGVAAKSHTNFLSRMLSLTGARDVRELWRPGTVRRGRRE